MRTPLVLLKVIGKAVLNAVGAGVLGDILIEALPEIANNVWDEWGKKHTAAEHRAELEAVAVAAGEEFGERIEEVVREIAADASPEVRRAVADYLKQVPATIRRTLRRPADPTGTTVPADLVLRKGEDLLSFLPARLPLFQRGDRPLTGVDWVLDELLGAGGFGEVWKAVHAHQIEGFEPVALKFCIDPMARQRLLNHEAKVCAQVRKQGRHPGIVALEQTYLSADPPCLQYEYVEGGDLAGLILEWHRQASPPTPEQAARVVLRLAEIVGYFHRLTPRIVHRDLKPANILTQRANGETILKIADFGIGGIASAQVVQVSRRGASVGYLMTSAVRGSCTPMYASPQQLLGGEPDPRDDVHALGVIWYQILTGRLGQGRPSGDGWKKRVTDRGMSADLIALLVSCFEDDPDDRPDDGAVLAERLAALLATPLPAVVPAQVSVVTPVALKATPQPPPAKIEPLSVEGWQGTKAGDRKVLRLNDQEIAFRWCPPGSFTMGSPENEVGRRDNEYQVDVTLTKGFWMGETQVTQGIWEAVMGTNLNWSFAKGPKLPAFNLSLSDAAAFGVRLTELLQEGELPSLPVGMSVGLPTEAQWEYAARAGTTTPYPFGDDEIELAKYAWFSSNSGGKPHEVKTRKPNAWGLHDMLGNVWEWCVDGYGDKLPGGVDPVGPRRAPDRVLRGGSWRSSAGDCRSANRDGRSPDARVDSLGFRLAAFQAEP